MTIRASIIGLLFAYFISFVVYFIGNIVGSGMLIGNHFPIVVFGTIIILTIFVNPLISRLIGRKSLDAKEIALIAALGLAVCGWPGAGYFRLFTGIVTMPSNLIKINASWKANGLMSYVPGASFQLAEGHIIDWNGFGAELVRASRIEKPVPAKRLWELLPATTRNVITQAVERGYLEPTEKTILLTDINGIFSGTEFFDSAYFSETALSAELRSALSAMRSHSATEREIQRANRLLAVAALPEFIARPPRGKGVLLADGDQESPSVLPLFEVRKGKQDTQLRGIPWRAWWPTLVVWVGLTLLIAVAVVCLVIIFQPQWKRELLPFPIARFVTELAHSERPDGQPAVLRNKLFWYGFGILIVFHLINCLHAWFPNFIMIPKSFDFSQLSVLFPNARQVLWGQFIAWNPTLFPTVIAFAFFLSTEASFSVGFSGILFMMLISVLISNGIAIEHDWLDSGGLNLLIFGAYLGILLVLLYIGRRYYFNVLAASIGGRRHAETPLSSVWAARLLCLCIIVSIVMLSRYDVEWYFGAILIFLSLLMMIVMTRINVETGAFFMQPYWMPIGVMTTLFGMQSIGPTAFIVMSMMCMVLMGDAREIMMPYIANSMHMATEQSRKAPPARIAILVGIAVITGFIVTLSSTLFIQYNNGMNLQDRWATQYASALPFTRASIRISELSAYDELSKAVNTEGLNRLALIRPNQGNLPWIGLGVALVLVTCMMRLRFSWWPLHPVAFVVWGNYAGANFAPSFIVGWFIKMATVKLAGARGFYTLKPFMIGVIAGELFSAICWSIFGAVYYFVTNVVPKGYGIFPG